MIKDIISIIIMNFLIAVSVRGAIALINRKPKYYAFMNPMNFIAQYGLGLKIIVLVSFLVLGFFCVNSWGIYLFGWAFVGQETTIGTCVAFTLIFLLPLSSVCGVVIWKIEVSENLIKYTDYIGIIHRYNPSDITKVIEKHNGNVVAYKGNRPLFIINENMAIEGTYMIMWAQEHGIFTESIKSTPKQDKRRRAVAVFVILGIMLIFFALIYVLDVVLFPVL